ncbi:MAG TPA: hypothetical protein VMI75_00200 [Polyangiaceae bacterium]|nr:hypothetical protein [Polyangiaceae bacterium]
MKPGQNEFFASWHFGTLIQASPEAMKAWGLAVRKIVSADGMSEKEKERWVGIGRLMGATDEDVAYVMGADLEKVDLPALLKNFGNNKAAMRGMLYDAIVISSADGYSEKERALAAKTAALLGVETSVLHTLESLVEAEHALRRARGALISGQ